MCAHSVKFSEFSKKSLYILKQYLKSRLLYIANYPLGHVSSSMKNCRYIIHLHAAPSCGIFEHCYKPSHFLVLAKLAFSSKFRKNK